jgi:streptogramin lyase
VRRVRSALMLLAASGLCVSAALVATASASASLVGEVTEFSTGITANSGPSQITEGPEGDLWFTEQSTYSGGRVVRMTPTGEVTEHEVLEYSEPRGIAVGPEGDLWFAEINNVPCEAGGCPSRVGRINPTTDAVAEFTTGITEGSQPWDMALGPDGNLWFSERTGPVGYAGQMARINPKTDEVKEFKEGITGDTEPDGVTAGPDGNVWFTEEAGNRIGRITPGGTITEFPIPSTNSEPVAIVTGSDGNLWFAEQDTTTIGRITPTGTITEFPLSSPDNEPRAIAAGPDGNIWFAMDNGDIGRITPAGVVTTCTTGIGGGIEGLTAGPDESMWFTEYYEGRIGKITATGTGLASNCTGGSTPVPAATPPAAASTPPPQPTPAPPTPATATVKLDGSNLGVLKRRCDREADLQRDRDLRGRGDADGKEQAQEGKEGQDRDHRGGQLLNPCRRDEAHQDQAPRDQSGAPANRSRTSRRFPQDRQGVPQSQQDGNEERAPTPSLIDHQGYLAAPSTVLASNSDC